MAYNELLSIRVRSSIALFPDEFTEKKMFGGLVFLYKGKMTIGIVKDKLAVRVISSKMDELLKHEAIQPMDFTKKAMKEFLYVLPQAIQTETELLYFIELGIEHAKTKLKEI